LFITSANQLADNAATHVHMIYERQFGRISATCFYPPFSPQWNFSFKGCLINKGATKVFYDKLDEELGLRM
jgi:hypothetical protein